MTNAEMDAFLDAPDDTPFQSMSTADLDAFLDAPDSEYPGLVASEIGDSGQENLVNQELARVEKLSRGDLKMESTRAGATLPGMIFKGGVTAGGGFLGAAVGSAAGPLGTGVGAVSGASGAAGIAEGVLQTFDEEPYDLQRLGQEAVLGGLAEAAGGPLARATGAVAKPIAGFAGKKIVAPLAKKSIIAAQKPIVRNVADLGGAYFGGVAGYAGSILVRSISKPVLSTLQKQLAKNPVKQEAVRRIIKRTQQDMNDIITQGLDPNLVPKSAIDLSQPLPAAVIESIPAQGWEAISKLSERMAVQLLAVGGKPLIQAAQEDALERLLQEQDAQRKRPGRWRGIRQ